MDSKEKLIDFISAYAVMVGNYKPEISARRCAKLVNSVDGEAIYRIFNLFCYAENMVEETLDERQFTTMLEESFKAKSRRGEYLLQGFWTPGISKISKKYDHMIFFHQLLLCLQMEQLQSNSKDPNRFNEYLLAVPEKVLKKEIEEMPNKIKVRGDFSTQEGMDVLDDFLKKYQNIFYPLKLEKYRADFVWIKAFFEKTFWEYAYGIGLKSWNVIK